jgi:O-antigen/teichoic acid export membrane protein
MTWLRKLMAKDAENTHVVLMVLGTILINFVVSFGLIMPIIGWFGALLVFLFIFSRMWKYSYRFCKTLGDPSF